MSEPPLPDVIERACAWLRSLQFGQPDAYNCADLLEQMAREAANCSEMAEALRGMVAKFAGERVGQGGAYSTDEYPQIICARAILAKLDAE